MEPGGIFNENMGWTKVKGLEKYMDSHPHTQMNDHECRHASDIGNHWKININQQTPRCNPVEYWPARTGMDPWNTSKFQSHIGAHYCTSTALWVIKWENIKPSKDLPGHTPTVIGFNTTSPWSAVIQLLHSFHLFFKFQLQCLPKWPQIRHPAYHIWACHATRRCFYHAPLTN